MARWILTAPVLIPASGYAQPERKLPKGAAVELSAAEVTAITGAGGAVRTTTARDALGESAGVSN